jgi:hypothetical protein
MGLAVVVDHRPEEPRESSWWAWRHGNAGGPFGIGATREDAIRELEVTHPEPDDGTHDWSAPRSRTRR